MASPSRLDCSLDQLIDQSATSSAPQTQARPRREAGTRSGRRVVTTATSPLQEPVVAVKKQPIKKQPQHNRQSQPQVPRLTPAEAAVHVSNVRKEENGDVVVSFKNTDVLIAHSATGDLVLNSGGFRTFSTRAVLCAALQPVGLKVDGDATKGDDEEADDNWCVSDGRSYLQKFEDGMVIQNMGRLSRHQLLARASVILQFMQQRKAGLAKKAGRYGNHHGQRSNGVRQQRKQMEERSMMETVDD